MILFDTLFSCFIYESKVACIRRVMGLSTNDFSNTLYASIAESEIRMVITQVIRLVFRKIESPVS